MKITLVAGRILKLKLIMEKLRKTDKYYLKGYARALQDMMFKLTGDNTCCKSYDPLHLALIRKFHQYLCNLLMGDVCHHL